MKTFKTSCAYLASTLLSLGYVIEHFDKSNIKKVVFHFKRIDSLDEAIQAYWAKELKIEPQLLFANYKQIKNRIYSE